MVWIRNAAYRRHLPFKHPPKAVMPIEMRLRPRDHIDYSYVTFPVDSGRRSRSGNELC